jgi:DNA-binding NarL/FixJ family response regulator
MKILILDDHKLFLDGMRWVVKNISNDAEIFSASSVVEALEIIENNAEFDLILFDLNMPERNGISFLKDLSQLDDVIPSIAISASENIQHIRAAIQAGALGFIPKSFSGEQMLDAIALVLNGDIFLPDDIKQKINALKNEHAGLSACLDEISSRQLEVLQLISAGHANKIIAEKLGIKETTIKTHISALFQLLQASNRTECVQKARTLGLIDIQSE